MGFASTIEKVTSKLLAIENLNKGCTRPYPRDVESILSKLNSMYDGMKQIPKEEFGRFKDFDMRPLEPGTGGVYYPGSRTINVDPYQSPDPLNSFIHELTHGRQYNPDENEVELMKSLLAVSPKESFHAPVEQLARNTAALSTPKPSTFGNNYVRLLQVPAIQDSAEEGAKLLKSPLFSGSREAAEILRDLFFVRKYDHKNFLSLIPAAAGVGMTRTGE